MLYRLSLFLFVYPFIYMIPMGILCLFLFILCLQHVCDIISKFYLYIYLMPCFT